MVLNLSPLMNVLFNIPAAMICAVSFHHISTARPSSDHRPTLLKIASTRAVRSLARWTQDGPHILQVFHEKPIQLVQRQLTTICSYSDASLPSSTGDIEWRVPPDQSDAFSSATRNTRRHTADAVRVQVGLKLRGLMSLVHIF